MSDEFHEEIVGGGGSVGSGSESGRHGGDPETAHGAGRCEHAVFGVEFGVLDGSGVVGLEDAELVARGDIVHVYAGVGGAEKDVLPIGREAGFDGVGFAVELVVIILKRIE